MKYLPIIALLLATGCTQTHIVHAPLCLSVMEYSSQSQTALANELRAIKPDSQIVRYLLDYKRERDRLRVCRKSNQS